VRLNLRHRREEGDRVRVLWLGEDVVYVSASIGITLYPDDAIEVEQLLKNADQAMYAAKNMGRSRFSYFTYTLQLAVQNRVRLIHDLRVAARPGGA